MPPEPAVSQVKVLLMGYGSYLCTDPNTASTCKARTASAKPPENQGLHLPILTCNLLMPVLSTLELLVGRKESS